MLDNPTYGENSGTMSGDTRQSASCRPAAVAVHDDGHMQSLMHITLQCKVTAQKKFRPATVASRVSGPTPALLWLGLPHPEPPARAWKDTRRSAHGPKP